MTAARGTTAVGIAATWRCKATGPSILETFPMFRLITVGTTLCILMARPADLFGQINRAAKRFDPNETGLDPRVARA